MQRLFALIIMFLSVVGTATWVPTILYFPMVFFQTRIGIKKASLKLNRLTYSY